MFIAKENTWFKENTEAILLEDYRKENYNAGRFQGVYIVGSCNPDGYDKFWYEKGFKDGDEVVMIEICSFDEFEET